MNIQKSTDELLKILNQEEEIENYIEENKEDLIDLSLSDYLDDMLKKYNITKNEAINNSALNQIYGYQIRKTPPVISLFSLYSVWDLMLQTLKGYLKLQVLTNFIPVLKGIV